MENNVGGAVDRVVTYIREYALKNALEPGAALPAERDIARSLKVSRNSVREALGRLRAIGVIESRNKAVSRLAASQGARLVACVPNAIESEDRLRELTEFRVAIEVSAVSLAAMRATLHDLRALAEIVDQSEAAIARGYDAFNALDEEFHARILAATGNSLFASAEETIRRYVREVYRARRGRADVSQTLRQTQAVHRDILRAIEERDPLAAAAIMRVHLRQPVALRPKSPQ